MDASIAKARKASVSPLKNSATPGDLPVFPPVAEHLLQKTIERIISALDPQQIILFGSCAYGRPGPDSDVDLLVVMETDDRPAERIMAVSRLLSPRPFPVDIVVRTPGELARDLNRVDSFIRDAVEHGRVLYTRPCGSPGMDRQG